MPIDATRQDVQRLVAEGAQLVEVLAEEEYAWAHLPGAVNVPLRDVPARLGELDVARPVVVYCHDTV